MPAPGKFQPFTIPEASTGGFSCVMSPPTVSGSISCLSGDCYVAFLSSVTAGVTTGSNSNVTEPVAQAGVITGWAHIPSGGTLSFGLDPRSSDTPVTPVAEIDIWCNGAEVVIIQH